MRNLILSLITCCASFGCSSDHPAASSDAALDGAFSECKHVGAELCAKLYACRTPAEITQLGLPPDEAGCVAQQNTNCGAAKPGFCKGAAETSETAASACADELHGFTCAQFDAPTSTGPCKQGLCAP